MRYLRILALFGICLGSASFAHAQRVAFGVGVGPAYVGPAPVCAYGYYGYYPYACAPYGYYGPDYFVSGVFIGTGPWFHGYYGRSGFYGRPGFYGHPGYYGHGFVGRVVSAVAQAEGSTRAADTAAWEAGSTVVALAEDTDRQETERPAGTPAGRFSSWPSN